MQDDGVIAHGAENCYYRGRVHGHVDSIVAVNTCGHGLDGFITGVAHDTIIIEPFGKYNNPSLSNKGAFTHQSAADASSRVCFLTIISSLTFIMITVAIAGRIISCRVSYE
jgi:hypothetical protein